MWKTIYIWIIYIIHCDYVTIFHSALIFFIHPNTKNHRFSACSFSHGNAASCWSAAAFSWAQPHYKPWHSGRVKHYFKNFFGKFIPVLFRVTKPGLLWYNFRCKRFGTTVIGKNWKRAKNRSRHGGVGSCFASLTCIISFRIFPYSAWWLRRFHRWCSAQCGRRPRRRLFRWRPEA